MSEGRECRRFKAPPPRDMALSRVGLAFLFGLGARGHPSLSASKVRTILAAAAIWGSPARSPEQLLQLADHRWA